jgi:hypothetical protein
MHQISQRVVLLEPRMKKTGSDRLRRVQEQRLVVDELVAQLTVSPYDDEAQKSGRPTVTPTQLAQALAALENAS